MIQDKIFFDEKDPTGLSYNTPFTYYGSYQGRLWSKSPTGSIQYYTQNSDLSAYATTGSNQFSGSQTVTGSLTVTGTITGTVAGTTATASYVEYTNVANKPALISGSAQIASFGIFATTGSNGFNGSQSITGSLTVTGQVVAQTLNVQQVTSSIVYSSGSNVFGNSLANTQQFTGSVSVTGSMAVNSSITVTGDGSNDIFKAVRSGTTRVVIKNGVNTLGINTDTINNPLTVNGGADFSGNVGIGVTSPGYRLVVNSATDGISAGIAGNTYGIRFDNGGTFSSGMSTVHGVDNTLVGSYQPIMLNGSDVRFGTSATERMRITSAGDLSFKGRSTTTNYDAVFYNDNSQLAINANNTNVGKTINFNVRNDQNAMTINSIGNVGIGTNSPISGGGDAKWITLDGNSYGGGFISSVSGTAKGYLYYDNGTATFAMQGASGVGVSFLTSNSEKMRITSGGAVGIGLTNPGAILDVSHTAGTTNIIRVSNGAGNYRWRVDQNFSMVMTNASNVDTFSVTTAGALLASTVRITNFTTNGLVGTDSSGNLGVVYSEYTEIATGTITYSMNSGSPWAINNSFPATIRNYEDDGMAGSGGVATNLNLGRGVTFDLGSAKAVRRIVERGYNTKNLNQIIVQYSTDNSNWTDIYVYNHVYGNTQKNMEFNPTGAISARYWRWFIHSWSEREVQNYYTYESIIYT